MIVIIFKCMFCLLFILLYLFWCIKHKTLLPHSISTHLSRCPTTKIIYGVSSMLLLGFFLWIFCRNNPSYCIIAVLAILIFIFDVDRFRSCHFIVTFVYIMILSIIICRKNKWFMLLLPLIVGMLTRNICLMEISFLFVVIWVIEDS